MIFYISTSTGFLIFSLGVIHNAARAHAGMQAAENHPAATGWREATNVPDADALHAERPVKYAGESPSVFSFFLNFERIVFRARGSVIPKIVFEILISTVCGIVAFVLTTEGEHSLFLAGYGAGGVHACIFHLASCSSAL